MEGLGRYTWTNGDYWEGTWENRNKRQGKLVYADGRVEIWGQ